MLNSKLDIPVGIGKEFGVKYMGDYKALLKAGSKVRILYIHSCYSKIIIGDKKK